MSEASEDALRIGLVTGEYPPQEGGVGAFTRELAKALADLGHELHIFTDRRARPATGERRVAALLEPVDVGYGQIMARGRRWRWREMGWIADWAIRQELDVVNIQYQAAAYNMRSPAINFLPWRLQGVVPTAVTFHDLRVPYLFPKAGRLRWTAVRSMARRAAGVIATNEADLATLAGAGIERLAHVPIGSNIPVHQPPAGEIGKALAALGVPDGRPLLGYFGFLNPSKGADTLLRALARLEEAHLVLIGGRTGSSDPDNNAAFAAGVDDLAAELGVAGRVHATGFVDEAAVSTYLAAADVMVMPYRDGVSLRRGTLLAALAHGRPIVSTAPAGPVAALRHGENIWLVPPEDEVALATAVMTLLADPALRQSLAAGAAALAAEYTWPRIAAQTADFLRKLTRV